MTESSSDETFTVPWRPNPPYDSPSLLYESLNTSISRQVAFPSQPNR